MKTLMSKLTVLVVAAMSFVALADGEGITNATFNVADDKVGPQSWNDSRMWVDGVPADGVGATATVRINGAAPNRPTWVNFDRDVTLGHILRPADDTQGAAFSSNEWRPGLEIRWDQIVQHYSDPYTPFSSYGGNKTVRHYPVKLTMDSGSPSTKASIQHLVPSATMNGKRFGFFIEPPICLKSDLYLKYIGPSDRIYGGGWSSGDFGSFADGAMYLTGGISEGVAGRGVEIDNPVLPISSSYVYTPVFFGGDSTFTGPLNITSGMLRLLGEGRFEGDCHALGANNHIYATSGNGVLDLNGTRAGVDGNTLHLGGVPQRTVMGTLINSNPDPLVPGEWAGAISIDSATKIGGYTQNPNGANMGAGDIVLSGPVSGSADVEIVNMRETVLAGDNSNFTGNWNLSNGGFIRLRGENPIGQGKLLFKSWTENTYYNTVGTSYRFGAADDADLTLFDGHYDISNQNFRIDVAAGLEYHPAAGFKGLAVEKGNATLYKSGPGTLRLTEPSSYTGTLGNYDWTTWLAICDGTVVMDFTENPNPKLVGSKTGSREGTVRFGEHARLEIRGTPVSGVGYWQYEVRPGSFGTIHFDDAGHSGENGYWFSRGNISGGNWGNALVGVLNIEADPAKWELLTDSDTASALVGQKADHDAHYPSIRHPLEIWNGTTFTKRSATKKYDNYILEPAPDSWYATDFATVSEGATGTTNSLVDVTAALCAAGTHTAIECAALRFNTPNGGTPVILNLDGTCKFHAGTILITPNMGDTPVVIRGGHIVRDPLKSDHTSDGYNQITIINMNTNATVTIESDLGAESAQNDGKNVGGTLFFAGPGKTVFTGKFLASGAIGVNGGVVSVGNGQKLLASYPARGAQWDKAYCKYRETYLYGGGLIEFTEDASWTYQVTGQTEPTSGNTYVNGWRPYIGVSGGGFSVAKGKTFTVEALNWPSPEQHFYVQRGATFIKAGEGAIDFKNNITWNLSAYSVCTGGRLYDYVFHIDLRGGTLARYANPANNNIDATRIFFGANGATILTAQDGTALVGREFSTSRLSDCNRPAVDSGNGVRIVIPEGATVTHDRHSTGSDLPGWATFAALEHFPTGLRDGGIWAGAGTLVLTNSQGTAGMGWVGFKNRLFTGTIKDYLGTGDSTASGSSKYIGYVPALENARLLLPEGVAWYIGYGMDLDGSMRFRLGGLDGDGTIDCQQRWTSGFESLRVGSDDGESHDFAGYLRIARNGGLYGQLIKVGSNTQRVSGTANQLQTSAKVGDGTLVLGHLRALDSTDLPNYSNSIYVGGDETTAGMNPRFLVDCGNVTVSNKVKVLGCAATPAVGAKTGTVTFKDLTVSNACTFVAEAGATAKFEKITTLGGPYAMGQSGAGIVEMTGDFAVEDSYDLAWGGQLVVGGILTVANGTKFNLTVSAEQLEPGRRYTLVSAEGGIIGNFDFSNVVLPRGWRLKQTATKVVLQEDRGMALIVR